MKKLVLALCFAATSFAAAFAAEVEGTVESVDLENMMITLDNGTDYKVSGNIPLDLLAEGAKVVVNINDADEIITDIMLIE